MTDRTTADADHHEHEARASGRPEEAGPQSHGVPGRGQLARSQLALPAAMILTGIVSVQYGAGLADKLFGQIPPAAVTGLRLWTSAVAMAVISGRGLTRALRVQPRAPDQLRDGAEPDRAC